MGWFSWKDEDTGFSIAFLPVIGALIGVLEYISVSIAMRIGFGYGTVFIGMGLPLLVTGGLHVDGFMDTSDAMNSYAPAERKLEILKDSHIGAFAVIRLLLYVLVMLGFLFMLYGHMTERYLVLCCCVFVISRLLAGFGMVYLRGAKKDGLFNLFAGNANVHAVRIALIVTAAALSAFMLILDCHTGVLLISAGVGLFFYYRMKMNRELGGITGDTEGWLICVSELVSLFMIVVGGALWNFM